ncbi:MAG: response regulator [Treponema sp.]|nr:response regulator [Treponema sp.]
MRVLVVDDDPQNREILKRLIERLGAEVRAAGDGQEALQAFGGAGFDLVLLDLSMPGMDGLEVAAAMRSIEAGEGRRRAAIVALSGLDENRDFMRSGIDEFIQKPVGMDILRAALERWAPRETS